MAVDYLAMVSDPEELLSIAHSIDGAKISQLLGGYQQMVQAMTDVGQFGHDVDNAAASQLFGKFVDEAHHESTVLSYAALNVADTCNRMKAKLSNFYEQYVEKVQPAAQVLQQAYDAQLGHGSASSPAELRTASTALAKALGHLYTDLAGNPTINVAPTFPEAAIPDIGADGRRTADKPGSGSGQGSNSQNGSVSPGGEHGAPAGEQRDGSSAQQGEAGAVGSQSGPGAGSPAQAAGSAQAGGGQGDAAGGGAATLYAGGSGSASPSGKGSSGQGSSGKGGSGKGGSGQDSPASALGGALGALGQLGSSLGSAGAGLAGAASTGAGIASGAAGLGTSLGSLSQPASAESSFTDSLADSSDDVEGKAGDSTAPAATKPTADFSAGGGAAGTIAHPLADAASSRGGPSPELRFAPAASLSAEPVPAGGSNAMSNGMMGMPMMGAAGMNGANGEHRVANYLISKEQGERQFTSGLPLASEEILGDLDARERLAMQIASIDDPTDEAR